MLSQSLYMPSKGFLYNSIDIRKPIPEVKDMSKQLQRLSKYDLECKPELNIKYQIDKIYLDFEESLSNFNFKQVAAPFITNTFHVQRKKALKALDNLIKDLSFTEKQFHYQRFVQTVDLEYLSKFQYLIKEPYVDLVFQKHYNLPKDVNIQQVKEGDAYKELYALSVIISIWSIEIELSADLVERAILYKLYKPTDEKNDIIQRLKNDKKLENKFTVQGFSKRLLRTVLSRLIQKMSSFFSTKGFSFTSISWSACLGLIYYVVGQAAFPWTLLVGNVSIPWICGGFLASKLLDKIGKKISRVEVINDLIHLENAIKENTDELKTQYHIIWEAINKCLAAESEKELDFFKEVLRKKIDNMLDPTSYDQVPPPKVDPNLKESRLCLSMLTVEESDDWVICDIKEDDGEEEDPKEDILCQTVIMKPKKH